MVVTCWRGVQPRCSEHEATRLEDTDVVDRGKSAVAALQTFPSSPLHHLHRRHCPFCTLSSELREEGEDGSGQPAEKKSLPPPPAEDCATSGWWGMGGGGGRPPVCKCTALANEALRSTQLSPFSKLIRCSRRCGGEPAQHVHECAAGPTPPPILPTSCKSRLVNMGWRGRGAQAAACSCVILPLTCFASAADASKYGPPFV